MASEDESTDKYFLPQHIMVFKRAAKLFKVYIAVRRINPKSLAYMDPSGSGSKEGYAPKLIDCKAKTAKSDLNIKGRVYKTAGLVIDCDFFEKELGEPGALAQAFTGRENGAKDAWKKFVAGGKLAPKTIYRPDGKSLRTIEPAYTYYTQRDPSHEHYGCLRHSPTTQARGGKYIHGDYDLYAVVPAGRESENVFVVDEEKRLGEPHTRSKHQMDVQNYVTSNIGPGMISHGEQETFKQDLDDKLDLFHPDGVTVEPILGEAAIRELYASTGRFKGRLMGGKGVETIPAGGGQWVTPLRR
jgi:hypothetical protein